MHCILILTCSARSLRVLFFLFTKVLGALGTETTRPSSAAQCVAYIGVIELTVGQWQNVITILVNNLTGAAGAAPNSELLKEASLEAIGYICADIVSNSTIVLILIYLFVDS